MTYPADSLHFLNPSFLLLLIGIVPAAFLVYKWAVRASMDRAHSVVVTSLFVAFAAGLTLTVAEPMQSTTVYSVAYKINKVIGLLDDSGSESVCFYSREQLSAADPKLGPNALYTGEHCYDAFQAYRDLFGEFIGGNSVARFGLTTINDKATIQSTFSDGNAKTIEKLKALKNADAGTDLRTGIETVLSQFEGDGAGRLTLLIMSDGQDEFKPAALAQLENRIINAHVQVFLIKNVSSGQYSSADLDRMVEYVHGTVFPVQYPEDMRAAFNKVSAQIQPEAYTQSTAVVIDLRIYFGIATAVLFIVFAIAAGALWSRRRSNRD